MMLSRQDADAMAVQEQGKLADKPLAELIRELGETSASGAVRLSRDRAKAVVYFENGSLIFAASNIRAHRLAEFLKRRGVVNDESLATASPTATDAELLDLLVKQDKIKPEQVANIRTMHVTDILRGTLLWTEGDWQFDARVRLAADTRVTIDAPRLLLESTRHLPAAYVAQRFPDPNEQIEATNNNGDSAKLLPAEAFVASRLNQPMTISELQTVSGLGPEETLRAVYALAISGLIQRGTWAQNGAATPEPKADEVEEFVARIDMAVDHYDVLGVAKHADPGEIKTAYHALARRYHPDRFHQADAALRTRIETAFARIARASETLGDAASRAAYDTQLTGTSAQGAEGSARDSANLSREERAAASFQKAVAAMKQNQAQQAIRFFAEAASLDPRCARYRAEYGRALVSDPQTRRSAEIELKAAVALEPSNANYRIVLAELYKVLGLRRRAEGELQRALLADPQSQAARALLAELKK